MKILKSLISLILIFSVLSAQTVFSMDADYTYLPCSDTYVSSVKSNSNYSTEKELLVSADSDNVRRSYISFNIGNLPIGSNIRILLILTAGECVTDEESVVNLYGLKTHDWKQSTVTYESVPTLNSVITTLDVKSNEVIEIDVTEYVENNISVNGYVSFAIVEASDTDSAYTFASVDAKDGKPQLIIQTNYIPKIETEEAPFDEAVEVKVSKVNYDNAISNDDISVNEVYPFDFSEIPDDLYIEDYTTTRYSRCVTRWLITEETSIANGFKGVDYAQRSDSIAISPINPNLMLIGSNCEGIYRTDNGGKTVKMSCEGFESGQVGAITFYPKDDSIAFAVGEINGTTQKVLQKDSANISKYKNIGMYKSTDSGRSWTRVCDQVWLPNSIRKPTIIEWSSEVNDNGYLTLYCGSFYGQGIYKTGDLGATWEALGKGILDNVYAVKEFGKNNLVAGTSKGIFISNDGGKTWYENDTILKGISIIGFDIEPINNKHWMALTDDALYESIDYGNNWSQIITISELEVNKLYSLIYASPNEEGICRLFLSANMTPLTIRYSDDNGRSWTVPYIAAGTGYWADCIATCENYPNVVATGTGGVSISTDYGENFYNLLYGNSGIRAREFIFDEENPSKIFSGYVDLGIAHTESCQSDEWYPMNSLKATKKEGVYVKTKTVYGIAVDPKYKNRILYITGSWTAPQAMYESLDGGYNFYRYATDYYFDPTYRIYFHKQNPNVIYCGTLKSYDNGETWEQLPMGVRAMSPVDSDVVYSTREGQVYISEDGGKTFRIYHKTEKTNSNYVYADLFDPYSCYVGTSNGYYAYDESGYTLITDPEICNTTLSTKSNIESITQDPRDPNHFIIGGRDISNNQTPTTGVWETFDAGYTWRTIEIPAPADVFQVSIHPTRSQCFIGTSGGTYVYEWENNIDRPDCHYFDTQGTYCEEAVNYLWDIGYIGEDSALYYNLDRYVFEGDFLEMIQQNEVKLSQKFFETYFEDVDNLSRYYACVMIGLENGLVLKSDGVDDKLNILFKKLTHGMCAKYLSRLLKIKGVATDVSASEISKYMTDGVDAETAYAIAVLYKTGVLNAGNGFEFSADKVITKGEMSVLLANTLKLYRN